VPDGKPVIGFIPDLPNVLIATGHEGNGLTMVIHCSLYQCAPVTSVLCWNIFFLFSWAKYERYHSSGSII
jgi:hypothetical protein